MNKIDFALVITAERCNPNADPITKMPRRDFEGFGEISDVCLKRKIRDRLYEMGENIINLRNEQVTDGNYSIAKRVKSACELEESIKAKDVDSFCAEACRKWYDVRAFGQVFGIKDLLGNVATGIRGPVTIGMARSLEIVDIRQLDHTKSTNLIDTSAPYEKDAGTFWYKYIINKGAYVSYGSIFPQLAQKTGFNDADVEKLKQAMIRLLDNDASTMRPSGSMDSKLFWMTHDSKLGAVSSAKAHASLNIRPTETFPYFTYDPDKIPGMSLEIY